MEAIEERRKLVTLVRYSDIPREVCERIRTPIAECQRGRTKVTSLLFSFITSTASALCVAVATLTSVATTSASDRRPLPVVAASLELLCPRFAVVAAAAAAAAAAVALPPPSGAAVGAAEQEWHGISLSIA